MAEKTMGERLAHLESWTTGHEQRCDDRQTAMGREIKDLKETVHSLNKGAWGLAIALLGWAAVQLWDRQVSHSPTSPPAAAAAVNVR